MTARRGDTRARIQQVALELFAEQGYERTSLREVAERLGVTKAALYYHFKSKEDIVRSFTEDYFAQLDALVDWGQSQPPSVHRAHDILERYIGIVVDGSEVFMFLERNQALVHASEEDGKNHRFEHFRPRLNALVDVIAGRGVPPRSRIRATAAIFAVSASCMFFMKDSDRPAPGEPHQDVPSRDELRKIVLEIADDLTSDIGG
ncbi:MAG TPA: TetR/AcrR family transcriptional regulator [Trebonia sp.]|nr:TetR/AcrR family transcriptional regulator [Trebonia sp.]